MVEALSDQARAKKLIKEFHKYWEENGEPHPSSNAYLTLTRTFFYVNGWRDGLQYAIEMEDIEEKDAA